LKNSIESTFVYRYLKTNDIRGDIQWRDIHSDVQLEQSTAKDFIKEATLTLDPGETDISFFRSFKENDANRILDVLDELRHRASGRGFSVNSGMMKLDFEVAHDDINDEGELVRFFDNDKTKRECRHYGLLILTKNSIERLEVVNALLELSNFYALKQKSKTPDTRDLLEFREPGVFFTLARDTPI